MKTQNVASESLSTRVRRTMDDLAIIRQSLLACASTTGDAGIDPTPTLDLELAGALKSVVDALRKLLWAYIEALAAQSGRDPRQILEWYKMELAVDMLQSLRSRPAPESGSFEQLVNNALEVTAMYAANSPRSENHRPM